MKTVTFSQATAGAEGPDLYTVSMFIMVGLLAIGACVAAAYPATLRFNAATAEPEFGVLRGAAGFYQLDMAPFHAQTRRLYEGDLDAR